MFFTHFSELISNELVQKSSASAKFLCNKYRSCKFLCSCKKIAFAETWQLWVRLICRGLKLEFVGAQLLMWLSLKVFNLFAINCSDCYTSKRKKTRAKSRSQKVRIFTDLVYAQDIVQKSHKSPEFFIICTPSNIFGFSILLSNCSSCTHSSVTYQMKLYNLNFVVQGGIYSYFSHKTALGLYLIYQLKTFQKLATCMSNMFFLALILLLIFFTCWYSL